MRVFVDMTVGVMHVVSGLFVAGVNHWLFVIVLAGDVVNCSVLGFIIIDGMTI